jgi:hypothetical protein
MGQYLDEWDKKEKIYFQKVMDRSKKIGELDVISGGSEAGAFTSGALKMLKDQRAKVEDRDEREMLQQMLGSPTAKDMRPGLTNITEGQGLNMNQFSTMSSAFAKPTVDNTWQRYLSAAQSQWSNADDNLRSRMQGLNFVVEQDGQNYWDEKAIINHLAGELFAAEKRKTEYQPAFGAAFGRQSGTTTAKVIGDALNVSNQEESFQSIERINTALKLLDDPTVQTGPTAKTRMYISRFLLDAFGAPRFNQDNTLDKAGSITQRKWIEKARKSLADPNLDIGKMELFNQISDHLGTEYLKLTKGAISDVEFKAFMSMAPTLSKTKDGNRALLKMLRRFYQKTMWKSNATKIFLREVAPNKGLTPENPKFGIEYAIYMNDQLSKKWNFDPKSGIGGVVKREDVDLLFAIDEEEANAAGNGGIPTVGGYSVIGEANPAMQRDMRDQVDFDEPICVYDEASEALVCYIRKDGIVYTVNKDGVGQN